MSLAFQLPGETRNQCDQRPICVVLGRRIGDLASGFNGRTSLMFVCFVGRAQCRRCCQIFGSLFTSFGFIFLNSHIGLSLHERRISMVALNCRQIIEKLFMSSPAISPDSDPRIEVLVMMVLDLQMEVEALRRTQLVANVAETESGDYGSAYRETACLTHNAAGMSFGLEKLLALFYPASTSPSSAGNEPRTWRESLMLERLGFSAQEIEEFKVAALQAETFS